MEIPTKRVRNPHGGVMIINKEDFDPTIHKEVGANEVIAEPEDEEPKKKKTRAGA